MSGGRKNGTNTGRNADGTFSHGNPGKPRGARHKATLAVEEILEGEAEGLTRKAVELALEGDTTALRLCLERIAPAKKDAPVNFELPAVGTAQEATEAAQAVLRAISCGDLTPLEGASLMGVVEQFRRILETTEIDARLRSLEEKLCS